MSKATRTHTIKRLKTKRRAIINGGLQSLTVFGSAILLSAIILPANASTLISTTDYLDYNLPKSLQERCIERENCPKIEVKYLKTNHAWINDITNARINNLVVNSKPSESAPIKYKSTQADVKAAIDDFTASQFADLPEDSAFVYNLMITPEYLGHVNNFELFEISSYVFTGGAHGMPFSEYLIFDQSSKKQIQLADMLQKGKESRFEALAYDAYKKWISTVADDVGSYEKSWPFTLSDNVSLTDKGIDIRYQHYSIGPYAYGMPVLSIPYSKLDNIIKPHFIPK
ncbi:RsiV family protein [Psychrobacter sp. ASPA161_9]|uniref:RsiV family protein n=1 Tax=Psychrobacter sp. ASPA161_9 TaxID=3160961 RepID=UPI003F803BD0